MIERALAADGVHEAGIEALRHQRPVDGGQDQHGRGRDAADQVQRRGVDGEDGAEQHVQQVNAGAAQRDDQHAGGERSQVEAREARILAQRGRAADQPRQQRHGQPGDRAAQPHRGQRQAGEQETDRGARQHGVAHRVADQAHPAQQQQHPD